MVKLEIRNLETSKSHLIDPGGVIIGREGGDAQIKLPDQGVSKKHARIYAKRGTWYLEDLDSANGTYLEDERITSAVTLSPGAVFTMSRQQFEVVQIVTEEPEATRAPRDETDDAAETNAMEPPDLPDRGLRGSKGNNRRHGSPGRSNAELRRGGRLEEDPPPTDHSASARVHTDPESEMDESPSVDPAPARGRGRGQNGAAGGQVMSASRARQEDSEVPAPSFAYFAAAIPRAIGYYLKTVPLMGLNPLGTIKKGIAEQPLPALSYLELIAYAIPAQLAVALVNAVCVAIVSLAAGNFSVMVLFPIVPLIIAAVSAAVGGFIAHPVLTWIVDKLEGQSDARSRSNFFVMVQTATILMALPTALATLLGLAARVPFINLLPPLLSLVATLVMVYLAFSWFRYFGVVQWFEYALLGLGLLACLATAWGLVGVIGATVRSFGSGGAAPVAAGPGGGGGEAAELMAAAQKRAEELAAAGDAAGAAKVMQEAALAAAKAASANPEAATAPPAPTDPPSAAAAPATATTPPETTPASAAAATPPAPTPPDPAPVAAATPPAPGPPAPIPSATPAVAAAPPEPRAPPSRPGKLSYPDYRTQREAIERAILEDPTVLRQGAVLAGYERLLKETKAAEAKFKPRDPREPHMALVNARLKDVAVYEATQDAVAELYSRMFKR
jgi:hypothetical protein